MPSEGNVGREKPSVRDAQHPPPSSGSKEMAERLVVLGRLNPGAAVVCFMEDEMTPAD